MKTLKILILLHIVLLSGCIRYISPKEAPHQFYLNPEKDLHKIGRVALVELTNNSSVHQISPNVTEALFQEVQKRQIFGLTKVMQDDPSWRSLQLNVDMNYSYEELAQIQKTLKCDAVLTGTITGFEPYPHMTIGLRFRMIDLSDGRLIWAMEQVWDTTDKSTRDRIEAYYCPKRILVNDENLNGQLGVISSLKFFKFVAYEITETLQPSD